MNLNLSTGTAISNFAPMKEPIPFFAAPGFENLLMAYSAPADTQLATQTSVNQELPPPPDDWGARHRSKCGAALVAEAAFCGKCGSRQNQ